MVFFSPDTITKGAIVLPIQHHPFRRFVLVILPENFQCCNAVYTALFIIMPIGYNVLGNASPGHIQSQVFLPHRHDIHQQGVFPCRVYKVHAFQCLKFIVHIVGQLEHPSIAVILIDVERAGSERIP